MEALGPGIGALAARVCFVGPWRGPDVPACVRTHHRLDSQTIRGVLRLKKTPSRRGRHAAPHRQLGTAVRGGARGRVAAAQEAQRGVLCVVALRVARCDGGGGMLTSSTPQQQHTHTRQNIPLSQERLATLRQKAEVEEAAHTQQQQQQEHQQQQQQAPGEAAPEAAAATRDEL